MNEINPFSSPTAGNFPGQPSSHHGKRSFPKFPLVMFIIGIVLCGLRLIMVLLGIVGFFAIPADDPLKPTVVAEVATGAGIAIFGLLGYTMMLMRKRVGIPLFWICFVSVLGSVIVGAIQLSLIVDAQNFQGPERIGAWVGGGIVIVIRLGIIVAMAVAVMQFSNWLKVEENGQPQKFGSEL